MRIGIDARPLIDEQPTGIGIYLRNIIRYIQKVDVKNEYFLYSHRQLSHTFIPSDNFHICIIPGRVGTLWLRYKLPKYLKRDLINIFWGTQHFLPKRMKGIYSFLTVHDVALLLNSKWGSRVNSFMQRTFLRPSVKEADKILAVSCSTKNDLIRICNVPESKIQVIYAAGLYNKSFSPDTNIEREIELKKKYFLYVGKIEPRKNLNNVIKAFNIIARKYEDIFLVIAGGVGWRYKGILNQIKISPFRDRIVQTGYVSDYEKEKLYQHAESVIFVSHYEGFGVPVLEAFAHGAPVITSNNSSLPEIGGDAAVYVDDENDVIQIVSAMEKVLNFSKEDRAKIALKGYQQAACFSWEKCAEETYKSLMQGKKKI